MANVGEKGSCDLYAVLGLNKDCSESDLRNAYKKLALKWHPDRCSASGNSKLVEEANKKFQAIQQAYSVLSDANKRFLYDVGVSDSDDDESGMGDFLNEMATMMSQTKPNENGEEELKQLFEEMFQADIASSGSASHTAPASSAYATYCESSNSNRCDPSEINFGKAAGDTCDFHSGYRDFCLGVGHLQDMKKRKGVGGGIGGGGSSGGREGNVQNKKHPVIKISSNDVSGIIFLHIGMNET